MQHFLILLLLLSATACLQKEITLDFPASEPRLVLEGLLIDSLPVGLWISKIANFNDEAFTYNVPNNTQVWIWKDGRPWMQLQSGEELGLNLSVEPQRASFFGSEEMISLERGSNYQIRASVDGLPPVESEAIVYGGRGDTNNISSLVYNNGLSGQDCFPKYILIELENARNRHYFYRDYSVVVRDPASNFPHLTPEEQEDIRREEYLAVRRSSYFDFKLLHKEVYGTNGTVVIRENLGEQTNSSAFLQGLCDCQVNFVRRGYGQVIEADSTITAYLLARRSYIDFGDAGLFSQQNLPSIPHNIINGYGYFGLANAYNFPLCN